MTAIAASFTSTGHVPPGSARQARPATPPCRNRRSVLQVSPESFASSAGLPSAVNTTEPSWEETSVRLASVPGQEMATSRPAMTVAMLASSASSCSSARWGPR